MALLFPGVLVEGSSYECGRSLGEQCRDRVHLSYEIYLRLLRGTGGPSPARTPLAAACLGFLDRVRREDPALLKEMQGIADGARLALHQVALINVRSELMSLSCCGARRSVSAGAGCTSFGVSGEASSTGGALMAQTWDWMLACRQTLILQEVRKAGARPFLMLTEAGLIGKLGINADGIGLCVNFLHPRQASLEGTASHVYLRRILESPTIALARAAVMRTRASAGINVMLADAAGHLLDLEISPCGVGVLLPCRGVLKHANHYVSAGMNGASSATRQIPGSGERARRAGQILSQSPRPVGIENLKKALGDHQCQRGPICAHAGCGPWQGWGTVCGVVVDPRGRSLHVAPGFPCETPFSQVTLRP